MKKLAIVLLVLCFVAVGVCSGSDEMSARDKARLQKKRMVQEAYFKKHGKYKKMKPFAPEKKEVTTPIDIASLKEIQVKDIANMQIYRIDWIELKPVKNYLSKPFGEDSRREIEAVIRLIKNAPKKKSDRLELNPPDRALVVRLVNGTVREIRYDSHLKQPFVGLESRKLKEALCGLSHRHNKLAVMHLKNGTTIDVHHMQPILVHRSGYNSSRNHRIAFNLTAEGDLMLELRVRDKSRNPVRLDGEKKITYGGAAVFEVLDGDDKYIAYLLEPAVN
jgi:hypothetical protein